MHVEDTKCDWPSASMSSETARCSRNTPSLEQSGFDKARELSHSLQLQPHLLKIVTLEPGRDGEPDIGLVQVLQAADVAGEEAPAQGTVGHNGNLQLTTGGDDFSLQTFQTHQQALQSKDTMQASFSAEWLPVVGSEPRPCMQVNFSGRCKVHLHKC